MFLSEGSGRLDAMMILMMMLTVVACVVFCAMAAAPLALDL